MILGLNRERALFAAWLMAFASSLSILFIGEVLGQMPCLLCWYQRSFMFPLAIILGLGIWWNDHRIGRYGLVLSLCGAAIALWHIAIFFGVVSEAIQPCTASGPSCTDNNQIVFGVPIPLLSIFSFTLIAGFSGLSLKE